MKLAALMITMCAWGAAPDEPCDPPFRVPVDLTMQACRDHAEAIALEWLRDLEPPYFEFMELRGIQCLKAGEAS